MSNYEIGYGKPPRNKRFKAGVSGNPRGRPKRGPLVAEEIIEVPWFRPPAKISIRQALTQAAMHSHYHRGQNATRLRELGGVPPMTDFIAWLHKGQPPAQWD